MSTVPTQDAPFLLSPSELKSLPRSSTVTLDVTWFMPNVKDRFPKLEFEQKHIPGARFWDLDGIASEHPLKLQHMMPSEKIFAEACESYGISPESHVVFYDTHGIFSSPRALLMFKAFGHKKASILNGGLPRWEVEGNEVESGTPPPATPSKYPTPTFAYDWIRDYEFIVANSKKDPATSSDAELLLDARPTPRFLGQAPEPREGLKPGHVPHSLTLPFFSLLQTNTTPDGKTYTTFLPPNQLRESLTKSLGSHAESVLGSKERKVVGSCGSGMTASVIWLALQQLGVQAALFDEAWTGYALRPESVIHNTEP
jgi:thiosulfate/3-mercaptopyruvate sulfurtransferase